MAILSRLHKRALNLAGPPGSMRARVARSASWVGVGYAVEMVLRLGSSLILTRLLSPSAFGIMATAQVFLYTAVMVSDVGVRSLVITHERSHDPEFLRTVWTFQIIRGVLIAAVVAILGIILGFVQTLGWLNSGNSFAEPMLPAIIGVTGITLAFEGLKSTNEHVMARDLRQDILVKLETGAKVLSTVVTIGAVWITRSVWGFVYAALIASMLRAVLSLLIVPGPRMQLAWNRADMGYVFGRGKWIGVSSWATLAGNLADKVLIGGFFGSSVLGLYTLALSIADALHSLLTQVTKAIALPVATELLRSEKSNFTPKFEKIRFIITVGSTLIGGIIIVSSEIIVSNLYDARYAGAALFLSIIALKYFVFYLTLNASIIQAIREFRIIAASNIIGASLTWLIAFLCASAYNLELLVLALSLTSIFECTFQSIFLIRLRLLKPIKEYLLMIASYSLMAMSFTLAI